MTQFSDANGSIVPGVVPEVGGAAVSASNPLPVALAAGAALAGKFGIDQTTPGTTDSVTVATGQGAGAAIGATNGAAVITDASGTIQQYLRGLIKQWTAGTLALATSGYNSPVTVTRPANQTPYTANDVVGGAITFANIGPSAGAIVITSASLEIDVTAIPSGMTSFRLYLYSVTPPSAISDNGAWDLPSGDRASYLGYVDIGSPVDLGSTLYVRADGINAQTKLASTSIFGYLVTNGGFTPAANSEVYVPSLNAVAL